MDFHPNDLTFISLCTGGGGLDRAVGLAIPSARPILCVEREAFAVANLVAQMQGAVMAPAPIWSDVRTVPGRRFRGYVDGVIGGIPCQPYSLAGKRRGRDDERDLWAPARRAFVQSGAWFILIENVGGMLSEGGAERVRRDLLRLGCQVEGGLFRASEVGFAHERERLFILGVARACGGGQRREGDHSYAPRSLPAPGGGELVDAASDGRREGRPQSELRSGWGAAGRAVGDVGHARLDRYRPANEALRPGRSSAFDAGGVELVDALSGGRDGWSSEPIGGPEQRAAAEWASQGPLFIPGPSDAAGWAWIAQHHPERLPAMSRHDLFRIACRNAGVDPDERPRPRQEVGAREANALRAAVLQKVAQSHLRRRPDGMATRIDELRLLGNGVVDLEGAYALRTLATDLARRSPGAALLVRMMAQ